MGGGNDCTGNQSLEKLQINEIFDKKRKKVWSNSDKTLRMVRRKNRNKSLSRETYLVK